MLNPESNKVAHGIGPASAPKMGPTYFRVPSEFSIDGILAAEHFVHARRSGMERYDATESVVGALRYIRAAYVAGWNVPCLSKMRLTKKGEPRKGFCDCVPNRTQV